MIVDRNGAGRERKRDEEREETVMGKRREEKGERGKVEQVLSGYFPYPKWLNLIPNSGSRARHKSRHKHPRCYFLFLPRASLPDTRPIRHFLPRLQTYASFRIETSY